MTPTECEHLGRQIVNALCATLGEHRVGNGVLMVSLLDHRRKIVLFDSAGQRVVEFGNGRTIAAPDTDTDDTQAAQGFPAKDG